MATKKAECPLTVQFARQEAGAASIENVMIDKFTGQVAYSVLSFGGLLGMGQDHYPLPWAKLKYNESLGGYVVNLTEKQLQGAPKYREDNSWHSGVDEYWEGTFI